MKVGVDIDSVHVRIHIYILHINFVCKTTITNMVTVRKFGVIRSQGGREHPT